MIDLGTLEMPANTGATHQCACGAEVSEAGAFCAECENGGLRVIDKRRREEREQAKQQAAVRSADELNGLFAKLEKQHGFKFDRAKIVHRCKCGAVVSERGKSCDPCGKAEVEELRGIALNHARRSLPEWDHARFDSPDFKRLVSERLRQKARGWQPRSGLGLTILGTTDLGKTSLAIAICRLIIDRAKTADDIHFAAGIRYVHAAELAQARRAHRYGGGEPPMLARAAKATLLLFDDVNKEKPADDDTVQTVLELRYRATRPTIITSELTVAQLEARYGQSNTKRMTGRAKVIEEFGDGR
jgi:DNA replication protein DnaC